MSTLDDICARKLQEVRAQADRTDLRELQDQTEICTTDVLGALRRPEGLAVIAEHKRRSPSKGAIRLRSDPAEVARAYEQAGAAAISILTDFRGFGGSPDDLRAARAAVTLPILRKDFILSPFQVVESRALGADLVLLIVAALGRPRLEALFRLTRDLGMTPLVEVHDRQELTVALDVGAQLIGVNNRNLHTFQVRLSTSEELAPHFPDGVIRVSESGIRTAADLRRLRDAGYDAVLIGETLMRARDPGEALRRLLA